MHSSYCPSQSPALHVHDVSNLETSHQFRLMQLDTIAVSVQPPPLLVGVSLST